MHEYIEKLLEKKEEGILYIPIEHFSFFNLFTFTSGLLTFQCMKLFWIY